MLGEPAYDPHHPELPVLVLCPEEFEFRDTAKKPNRYYIEPSVDLERKELYTFPWQDVNAVRPLIYCSLGSESHLYKQSETFFRAIIEAMRDKPDWQLVLATGPFMDPRSFDPVPENVLVVSWAPQLELIEKASIVITHGGLGGVKECILLGVPMIVFPCKWDQPFNAARVVAHGLGVRGNISRVSAAQIKAMIETIANNPSFQSRVDSMSKVFRDIEESGVGVRAVEKIMNGYRDERQAWVAP
jgi:zeaxanthin glucosyltransferase